MIREERTEHSIFPRKKIYTPEERRRYVQAWSETEDSLEKFCNDQDLEPSTFLQWAKKFKVKNEIPFRPVKIQPERNSLSSDVSSDFDKALNVAITFPNQLKIEITPVTSMAVFQQLIKVISSWN
jgi:transposase-like protein